MDQTDRAITLRGIECDHATLKNIVKKDPNNKFHDIQFFHDYNFAKDKDIKLKIDQTLEILQKRFNNHDNLKKFEKNCKGTILLMSRHGGIDINQKEFF